MSMYDPHNPNPPAPTQESVRQPDSLIHHVNLTYKEGDVGVTIEFKGGSSATAGWKFSSTLDSVPEEDTPRSLTRATLMAITWAKFKAKDVDNAIKEGKTLEETFKDLFGADLNEWEMSKVSKGSK